MMSTQLSFTKFENKLLPDYRHKISTAESTEDVKKFFVYTSLELFREIFPEKTDFDYGDITLTPGGESSFTLNEQLQASTEFSSTWNSSDLNHILSRLAETAINRYKHLEKNPAKTEAKIRR